MIKFEHDPNSTGGNMPISHYRAKTSRLNDLDEVYEVYEWCKESFGPEDYMPGGWNWNAYVKGITGRLDMERKVIEQDVHHWSLELTVCFQNDAFETMFKLRWGC